MICKDSFESNTLLGNLKNLQSNINTIRKKVSIIGCNDIGICCAVSILNCDIHLEICLIDHINPHKAYMEMLDLQHCAPPNIILSQSSEIEDSYGSDICVICVDKSAAQGNFLKPDDFEKFALQSTIDMIHYNIIEFKEIIPIISKRSPNAIFIIGTYPTTTMSYYTWKFAKTPSNRIFGIGTAVDTIVLKSMIANKMNIDVTAVNAYVVGATRLNFILWSEVTVAGTALLDTDSDSSVVIENAANLYAFAEKQFLKRKTMYERKGHPYFSNGTACARFIKAVLTDSKEIYTVAINCTGCYGNKHDIFMSLPCIIGTNGIQSIITPPMNNYELLKFKESDDYLVSVIKMLESK